MSYARLPDGSRIVDALRAAPGARVRRELDFDRLVSELRAAKNDLLMNELRALDGAGGLGRANHEELIRGIASALQRGSLVWEFPAGPAASVSTSAVTSPAEPAAAPKQASSSHGGTTVRAALFTGGTTFRKAPPPKKPKVTPELKLEYAVVLLRSPDATRVECSFQQDPAAPKFEKGLRLSFKGEGEVEAYADEALTTKLDLANPVPAKVFLKAVKAGLFEAVLEAEEDERFERASAKAAMAVVELNLTLHKQDVKSIGELLVNPDTDPVSKYHDDLKALKLPEQIKVTDAEKADGTRWLHVQRNGNHSRAKLVLRKLDVAGWPAGCDDYRITLTAKEPKVALYDVEWDGAPLPKPHAFKVSALKGADRTLWVEGTATSGSLGDIRLSLGLDRSPGGPDKTPKREGDVARLTVVEITEVDVQYTTPPGEATAWDEAKGRFYINLKPDSEGRELILRALLKPTLPGIPVHFMLAPDPDNGKAANWGVDLPTTWNWKNIKHDVKHCDRHQRGQLYNFSGATDANGVAKAAVILSRFGGDIFHPAAYITQDPQLTRYVRGVPELDRRKPEFAPRPIQVWRKIWYQEVIVEGIQVRSLRKNLSKLQQVYVESETLPTLSIPRSTADLMTPPIVYPRYMLGHSNDHHPGLVIGDTNVRRLLSDPIPDPAFPVQLNSLVCTGYWQEDGVTQTQQPEALLAAFPLRILADKPVLSPALQGGNLLVSGSWAAAEWDASLLNGQGAWANYRTGQLKDKDIFIDPGRGPGLGCFEYQIHPPSELSATSPLTYVWITDLAVKGCVTYAGTYMLGHSKMTCVDAQDTVEFQDNALHEIGHALKQVKAPGTQFSGLPDHPNYYYREGPHCDWKGDRCMMYDSSGASNPLRHYCPECRLYMLVEDLSSLG